MKRIESTLTKNSHTLKPLYSGHALQRKLLYSGHYFEDQINQYGIFLKKSSLYRSTNGICYKEACTSHSGHERGWSHYCTVGDSLVPPL